MNDLKSIKINKEIHKNLKIYCIKNDLKINSVLEEIINNYLKNNSKNDNR